MIWRADLGTYFSLAALCVLHAMCGCEFSDMFRSFPDLLSTIKNHFLIFIERKNTTLRWHFPLSSPDPPPPQSAPCHDSTAVFPRLGRSFNFRVWNSSTSPPRPLLRPLLNRFYHATSISRSLPRPLHQALPHPLPGPLPQQLPNFPQV